MEVLQARIDSFKKPKRVKNPNKPSSTVTVRWPHPPDFKANPETLAEAGFFYNPSYEGPDSVSCYFCDKELEGWEADDDPHAIHWKKRGITCCWATVRCGLPNDMDKSGRFVFPDKTRVPTHKLMEKARFDTFDVGKGWIHDRVKNHGANSKMMARAGFVYTPQQGNDDLATCLYCNTSLGGWDANDDPIEEHRKREEKSCPFFSAIDPEPGTRARSQSTKPPSRSQLKPPTRFTSKSKHQDILLPTKTHDGDPDNDSDSSQSTTAAKATAMKPRKGRTASGTSKSSAKTQSKTRSSSKSSLKNIIEVDEDEEAPLTTIKKKAKSKSAGRSEPEKSNAESETEKKLLRSRPKTKTRDSEDVPQKSSRSKIKPLEDDEILLKPSRTRSKNKVIESEPEEAPVTVVKSRSTSRTMSRSKPKTTWEPMEESEPEAAIIAPKKALAGSKHQSQTPTDLFSDDIDMENHIPPPSSPPAARNPPSKFTPLFIPKRAVIVKTATLPNEEDDALAEKKDEERSKQASISMTYLAESVEHKLPEENASVPLQVDTHGPLIPVSNHLSTEISAKDKFAAKAQSNSQHGDSVVKQKKKVIEVSSDEEPEEDGRNSPQPGKQNSHESTMTQEPEPEMRIVFPQSRKPKRSLTVEVIKPKLPSVPIVLPVRDVDVQPEMVHPAPSTPRPQTPEPFSVLAALPILDIDIKPEMAYSAPQLPDLPPTPAILPIRDVVMEPKTVFPAPSTLPNSAPIVSPTRDVDIVNDIEPETVYPIPQPQTPPNKVITPPPKTMSIPTAAEPPLIHALSKLPFTPLHALTEAELDMTVEEWIRYQMDVEYDKFRRDGERELQRFRNQAEEVRKGIEGL